MHGLSNPEIFTVVNRYIGVSGGYLGDFSYRSHAEFYLEFCDLDVNPYDIEGTTRERFLAILQRSEPAAQAKILRGVLRKYPVGSSELRTPERAAEVDSMIRRLEAGCGVAGTRPSITSEIVTKAINDAEALLRTNGASSGVDRMHTAFHGFLRVLCERAQIHLGKDPSVTVLYKLLRERHPGLKEMGPHADEIDRILKSFASAVDSLNTLRNRASIAYPNEQLLAQEEAYLYVNAVRTLMAYIDTKVAESTANTACTRPPQKRSGG
jgi:hypothetical protein